MDILVESCMYASRVTKTNEGEFNLEFSMLGGKTISLTYTHEMDARMMYSSLEGKVLEALNTLQEAILIGLSE